MEICECLMWLMGSFMKQCFIKDWVVYLEVYIGCWSSMPRWTLFYNTWSSSSSWSCVTFTGRWPLELWDGRDSLNGRYRLPLSRKFINYWKRCVIVSFLKLKLVQILFYNCLYICMNTWLSNLCKKISLIKTRLSISFLPFHWADIEKRGEWHWSSHLNRTVQKMYISQVINFYMKQV